MNRTTDFNSSLDTCLSMVERRHACSSPEACSISSPVPCHVTVPFPGRQLLVGLATVQDRSYHAMGFSHAAAAYQHAIHSEADFAVMHHWEISRSTLPLYSFTEHLQVSAEARPHPCPETKIPSLCNQPQEKRISYHIPTIFCSLSRGFLLRYKDRCYALLLIRVGKRLHIITVRHLLFLSRTYAASK